MTLQIYDDGNFDIKFIEATIVGNQLVVKTECPFGEDTIKVDARNKNYMHITGIPKWKYEVIQLLKRKYGNNFKSEGNTTESLIDTQEVVNSKL